MNILDVTSQNRTFFFFLNLVSKKIKKLVSLKVVVTALVLCSSSLGFLSQSKWQY